MLFGSRKPNRVISVEERVCKKQACALQHCFAKYNNSEAMCRKYFDAWEICAQQVRANNSSDESPANVNED